MVFQLKRDFSSMFNGCKNLEYINFITYNESKVINSWYLSFDSIVPSNLVLIFLILRKIFLLIL